MLRPTRALRVAYRGISLDTLTKEAGPGYSNTIEAAGIDIEERFPAVVEGRIQGTTPHPSSKDRSDQKKVVTVGFHTQKGTRYLSIHAHEDGTWKEFYSRAGKSAASPQAAEGQDDSQSQEKQDESRPKET
ncbi:hypothetical protein BO78DRAFT_398079 [Aspergillus sclerotiicarbonarius CBS 121057]|uniref:Uncharacterized protein n=1 Tax=Aspergillus sclerotiicarbonarius (strain CBS 121057 / IBT 28362) TaxID=1448318 RepID=A0A319E650_ASPSB|nr:hypothetical protein BO78DRAFT_398079 [Aspergillus sclerotiicarbonarius CBS 121057]